MPDKIDDILARYGGAPATAPAGDNVDALISKYQAPGPYRAGYKLPPAAPSAAPAAPAPEGPSQLDAASRGFVKGASAGFDDEAAGVAHMLPSAGRAGAYAFTPQTSPEAIQDRASAMGAAGKDYVEGRNERRAGNKAAQDAHPTTFGIAELGGTLATSFIPGGAAVKGASTMAKAGGAVARAGAAGAAYGAGDSEADLTRGHGAQFLEDAGRGAAMGMAVGAAGEGAKVLVKKGAEAVSAGLKRRILNEFAEGTSNTTATGRKRIDKAGNNIVNEVVKGPDSKAVRGATIGDAENGRKTLEPIINRVGRKTERSYEAFEKAGQSDLSTFGYLKRIEDAAAKAVKEGRTRDAEVIRAYSERAYKAAQETGGLTLTQVRGLTTEAQGIATSVLGSLNEHANAKVARRVEGVVTGAMSETLHEAAGGAPALVKAATTIEKNNKRMNALLTIDDGLKQRVYKENTGKSTLVRVAENVATSSAAGGAIGAATSGGDVGDRVQGGIMGAAVGAGLRKGIPAAARAVDRSLTTGAIKAAQGTMPITLRGSERLARALARTGAGMMATKNPDAEEDTVTATPRFAIGGKRRQ